MPDDPLPRIDFVLIGYTLGGMERQLASLIEQRPEWAKAYVLRTITFEKPSAPELVRRFAAQGIINITIERAKLSFPAFLTQLYLTMRHWAPDIVHTMLDGSAGTWGRASAILAGVPGIIQSDRSLRVGGTRTQRVLRPLLDRRTSLFLPNADEIRERIIANGVPAHKVHTVYSAVNLELFVPRAPVTDRSEQISKSTTMGFLGRFDRVKRLDVLLDALISLPPDVRPDRVLMAGDGPEKLAVERMINDNAWLKSSCKLLGTVEDVPAFLAELDYLVLPSEIEGFPNAILEAMAMAKPIVATRVSGVPSLVEGVGFLAEPRSVESLAEAIGKMQRLSSVERQMMGHLARQRVERDFDIRILAERFWSQHKSLLATVRSAPPSRRRR